MFSTQNYEYCVNKIAFNFVVEVIRGVDMWIRHGKKEFELIN